MKRMLEPSIKLIGKVHRMSGRWSPGRCSAGHQTHWQGASKSGVQKRAEVDLRGIVLAALVAVFPGINFILLDSDCLPITLFEAADLWKEGFLSRFPPGSGKGLPQQHPLHRRRDFVNRPDVVYTQHRVNADRQGQGVLLVTEPHSELIFFCSMLLG